MAYKYIPLCPATVVALTAHSHISPILWFDSQNRVPEKYRAQLQNTQLQNSISKTPQLQNVLTHRTTVELCCAVAELRGSFLGVVESPLSVRCSLLKLLSKAQVPTQNNNARDENLFLNTLRLYGGVNTVSYGRSQTRKILWERGGLK